MGFIRITVSHPERWRFHTITPERVRMAICQPFPSENIKTGLEGPDKAKYQHRVGPNQSIEVGPDRSIKLSLGRSTIAGGVSP